MIAWRMRRLAAHGTVTLTHCRRGWHEHEIWQAHVKGIASTVPAKHIDLTSRWCATPADALKDLERKVRR